jgi:flagellar M-ring protein FliF
MEAMTGFWKRLSGAARVSLVGGVALIALTMVVAAWWVFRTDYQVLFADLKPQDVVAMASELDKQKIPYVMGEGGGTILVDKAQVHATRIKLMGKELPLQGAVGFELFNNTDFGMTEFAQKINYQRALQGELTRTILSLAEIRDVRVHLALPEQGLFKQATSKSKAAITLTLRPGQSLRPEQVVGIQRLVAAATPAMTPSDVTVVDNQGVALSRSTTENDTEVTGAGSSTRLDLKKETENYLIRKLTLLLDRTFGVGHALASVDVTLNMDQMRTTTEDVISAPGRGNQAPAGVMVRERESIRDGAVAPLDTRAAAGGGAGSLQREVEYQVGKRVEQVVSQPGSIRRLQVVAVVRKALDATQEEQLKRVLAAAVGASPERGDTVIVQALGVNNSATSVHATAQDEALSFEKTGSSIATMPTNPEAGGALVVKWMAATLLLVAALLAVWTMHRQRKGAVPAAAMSDDQRQAALRQVQVWMHQDSVSSGVKL